MGNSTPLVVAIALFVTAALVLLINFLKKGRYWYYEGSIYTTARMNKEYDLINTGMVFRKHRHTGRMGNTSQAQI
jgi:hypothetical protein